MTTETENETTYTIVRFYKSGQREVIATGQTLEEAKEWCSQDYTRGPDWFDGFTAED